MTDHFPIESFRCKDGTDYPSMWLGDRWLDINGLCNRIRDRWATMVNVPALQVVSGYRTDAYNANLRLKSIQRLIGEGMSEEEAEEHAGPALHSQHEEGRAADLKPLGGAVSALHAMVLAMHIAGELPELGGLGNYDGWIHVDVRPLPADGHLARWGLP